MVSSSPNTIQGPLRLFVRASGFNEARHNGTPDQTNGTRLWRYAAGADWQNSHDASAALRVYGSTEHYRQTFSSISNLPDFGDPACSYRCGETSTRFTLIPDNELGAAAHWSQPLGAGLLMVAGADVHDVRIWDREQTYGSTAQLTNLSDHQRDSAAYAEAMWVHKAWTVNRLRPHGLVSELRWTETRMERIELDANFLAASAI